MQMLKTMVYLPPKLKEKIKNLAKSHGTSQAEVIRGALEEGLGASRFQSNASIQAMFKLAEIGKANNLSGPSDAATRFDDYLYSKDWSKEDE